jgi:hypothetical protein
MLNRLQRAGEGRISSKEMGLDALAVVPEGSVGDARRAPAEARGTWRRVAASNIFFR